MGREGGGRGEGGDGVGTEGKGGEETECQKGGMRERGRT